ncbi:hypothetical protein SDC9_54600 [bioreactor metagenome]|uniref:Bro-N domain-containing protein n=1 Tax=bioreactor metagenome TaxID=1076179 RepID=A0A644WXS3_9ZZZZ
MNNEIVIYQPDEISTRLEVRLENETVWLTQAQKVELFESAKQNISLHTNNIFKDHELEENSVVKYSLTTATIRKFRIVQN